MHHEVNSITSNSRYNRHEDDFVLCHSFTEEEGKPNAKKAKQGSVTGSIQTYKSKGSKKPTSKGVKPLSFVANPKVMRSGEKIIDPMTTPLFELAHLSPKEKQVNLQKLRTFLGLHGIVLFIPT